MSELNTDLEFDVEEKHHPKAAGTILYVTPAKAPQEMDEGDKATWDAFLSIPEKFGYRHVVPDDAEIGDTLTAAEIFAEYDGEVPALADDEDGQPEDNDEAAAAIEEAAETGERVKIDTQTVSCDGSEGDECSTDRVTRYATPAGEIEAERTHLY